MQKELGVGCGVAIGTWTTRPLHWKAEICNCRCFLKKRTAKSEESTSSGFFYYKGGCKSWKAESLTQTRCPENWPSGAQSGAQCQQHEDIIWKNLAGTTIVELWKALMTSIITNKQPVLRLYVFKAMTFNIEARNNLKLIASHLCILHRQCEIFLFVFVAVLDS